MTRKKTAAILLALALLCPLAVSAAAEQDEIHISTAEQLCDFAAACTRDTYSKGLKVVLDKDIDLSGVAFYPIPTFSGSFDGGGHSIYNMETATDGSHQGLFRYIQAEGEVHDLTVKGSVLPGSSRSMVGGIAGTNYGAITNCGFEGTVEGLNKVGGIAGENLGTISSCTVKGTVSGKRFTGGIAGYNTGLIGLCTNNAQVNTSISEGGLELNQLNLADIVNPELTSAEDTDVVSDTGGIAGFSSGVVTNCANRAAVGYPHYGYNVGGIVGRQSGYVNQCDNYGEVFGRKDVGGIVGQMEPYLQLKSAVSLSGELYTLQDLTARAMGNLSGMSQQVNDVLGGINSSSSSAADKIADASGSTEPEGEPGGELPTDPGASNGAEGAEAGAAEGTGETEPGDTGTTEPGGGIELPQIPGVELPDSIVTDLGDMRAGMNQLAAIMSNSTGELANDLVAVSQQLSRVIMLMASALSGADMTVFEDVSEKLPADEVNGRVAGCTNYGVIDADNNVGGVAGAMGIEYEFDMEGILSEIFGVGNILSSTYLTKCVCSDNVNRGAVTAKKDNCGGIAGLSDVGTVYGCEGYGNVRSAEGGCVGGIVGRSNTSVRNSYAMCGIDGTEYVGGIVGYGKEISGCAALIGIGDVTACGGAIAGWADMTAQGAVKDNLYVHERLGGVDGISYEGKAKAVSYDELMEKAGLPASFARLKLRFLADGRLIKELEFEYGSDLDESKLPAVPEKEGYSGRWPEYDYTALRFSDTIEAVYTPRQAAVAANRQREGSPLSLLLLEGDFEDGTRLNLNEYSGDGPELAAGTVFEKWVLRVENTELPPDGYTLRYLAPEEAAGRTDVYVYNDGVWTKVSTGRSGSYITFACAGDTVVFCAVESPRDGSAVTAMALGGAAIAAVLVIVLIRRRHTKKKAEAAK